MRDHQLDIDNGAVRQLLLRGPCDVGEPTGQIAPAE
jgi:hypothetical protein